MFRFLHNFLQPAAPSASSQAPTKRRRWRRRRPPQQKHARRPFPKKARQPHQGRQPSGRRKGWSFLFSSARQPTHNGTKLRRGEILAWHGTPNRANAKSILTHGWVVGNGNAMGDGVYASTDISVAKGYAGSAGCVLKLAIKAGRVATWSSSFEAKFNTWCTSQHCPADMSAKTTFLLAQGFNTLREGKVIVILLRAYRNPLAAKIRTRRIRVVSAVDPQDGKEIDLRRLTSN